MKKAPVCKACGVFVAQCVTGPLEARQAMCWPCAHGLSRHGDAAAVCTCARSSIYPPKYHEERGLL